MEAACEFSEGREGGGWLVVASAAFAQHRKGIWGETHKRTGVGVFCVFCFFLFDLFVWFLRMGVFAATGLSCQWHLCFHVIPLTGLPLGSALWIPVLISTERKTSLNFIVH